ncbi:MAG: sporulation transcriptional regulator SpoIIID [Clostridia bacterium]|nr:sporulation transcriptional regulator SpoIIID [Clostridia bacterium]
MKDYMIERIHRTADYILETGATVRACAAHFKVSKTTVHKDMRERLKKLNPEKAARVSRVLDGNREERHLRGGNATRLKYAKESGRTAGM